MRRKKPQVLQATEGQKNFTINEDGTLTVTLSKELREILEEIDQLRIDSIATERMEALTCLFAVAGVDADSERGMALQAEFDQLISDLHDFNPVQLLDRVIHIMYESDAVQKKKSAGKSE